MGRVENVDAKDGEELTMDSVVRKYSLGNFIAVQMSQSALVQT
jgi:hypothetical protein